MLPSALDGPLVLSMQFTDSGWLHRRVDRVLFMSDTLYRHHVSIDFDVNDATLVKSMRAAGKLPSRLLVPLGLMSKRTLTGFDLRDAAGASVPLLTSQETGEAAYQAVTYLGSRVIGPEPLSPDTQDVLRTIVSGQPTRAREALNRWYPAAHHTLSASAQSVRLMKDDAFKLVVNELVENFIALTPLTPLAPDGLRRVIKYSYVDELPWNTPRRLDHFFGSSARFTFPVLAAGTGYSYHFEVAAPENLDLRRLALYEATGDPPVAVPGKPALMRVDGRRGQMHVHMALADRYASHIAVVDLVPQRRGLVRSAWIGAVYATMALVAGYVWQRGGHKLQLVNVEALGAALLLIPAVAAVYVSRPGEHGMATRLAFGTRAAAVLAAVAAVLASVTLAIGMEGAALTCAWAALSWVAAVPTMYLTYIFWRSGLRVDYKTTIG